MVRISDLGQIDRDYGILPELSDRDFASILELIQTYLQEISEQVQRSDTMFGQYQKSVTYTKEF